MNVRCLAWLALTAACAGSSPPPLAPPIVSDSESWRKTLPKPGASSRLEYPVPVTLRLENGLSLWIVRRPARVVNASVVVRHGASSVPVGKSGLAALTARLMTESTRDRNPLELAEAVESLGSNLEHDAGRDYSLVGLTVLSSDLDRALDVLCQVARAPRFAPDELERVRGEWLDGLVAERQSPQRLASLAALRVLFGEPGRAGRGRRRRCPKAERRRRCVVHRRAWRPQAAALVLVGDVDPEHGRASAERVFGGWSREASEPDISAQAPEPRNRPGGRVSRWSIARDGAERAVRGAAVSSRAPPVEARQILSGVVGGLFTSRLNQNLRERNAYTYGARFRPSRRGLGRIRVHQRGVQSDAPRYANLRSSRQLESLPSEGPSRRRSSTAPGPIWSAARRAPGARRSGWTTGRLSSRWVWARYLSRFSESSGHEPRQRPRAGAPGYSRSSSSS
jgi:predicted Zn-dependent peptidase